ncbi:MAG TPA: ABC transporter substrate-binding protein [Mycobacteriales bacterium]|nr:ABC transporter substrate-binding protein [Mycobacteriales bacterium]
MSRFARSAVTVLAAAGFVTTGVLASAGAAAPEPKTATTSSMVVPVDRQDYTTPVTTTNPNDGSTVDPYDGDPSSIHVAITGGQPSATSYVHLALDYLPPGASPTDAVMTLHLTGQSDASNTGVYPIYNVNNSQAIIEACALVTELPSNFDAKNPPAYDCQHGSAVGRQSKDGQIWTFDLKQLLGYWHTHGDTGAALVGIGSGDNSQTWQVAFYRSRSTSTVTFTPPATSVATTGTTSAGAAPAAGGGARPASAVVPPAPPSGAGVSSPPAAAAPAVAGAPAASVPSPAPQPQQRNGSSAPVWPWVLVGSIALAGGSVAWAHRAAIVAALPRGVAIFRTHPRAYAVAAAALSWGLVFSGYSVITEPAHHAPELASSTSGTSAGTSAGQTSGGASSAPAVAGATTAPGVSTTAAQAGGAATVANQGNPSLRAAQTEFQGPGTYKTIDGVRVFFPSGGGVPVAQLYSGADDVVGLTSNSLKICAHAALTYGSAFHISASDLDVFWSKVNKEDNGIYGRKVMTNYQNDNYDPGTAVQAAQTCKDWGTFILLGGIGFDQIPAVRQWAEQNHELYLHHIATIEGSQGLRYSFSALPTVEQMGTQLGQIAARELPHRKIAIIYRQSSNWTPALAPFKRLVEATGSQIVGEYGVQINQGNYTQELTEARSAGAQVVLSWENSLSEIEMIKQAQAQNWHPAWLVNGFNIITNTLGSTALDQDMWSAGDWDAYDPGYYGGGFASYASQIHEFEAEYKKYDPNADLSGDGGDLLFLNWESQKWLYQLLLTCGKDCTRNKLAGLMLAGYHTVTPPNCPARFGAVYDHHHAGYLFNVLHAIRDPNGRANFVPVARCVSSF